MKYEEFDVLFVRCDKIDSSNIHEKECDDGVCKTCIDIYEECKDDLESQFHDKYDDKDHFPTRGMVDYVEVSQDVFNEERLKFGVWSEPF